MSKHRLLTLSLFASGISAMQAAVITGTVTASCPASSTSVTDTLSGPGGVHVECSGLPLAPGFATADIQASALRAYMQLFVQGSPTGPVQANGDLTVQSLLVLTGGSGTAQMFALQSIPSAGPTTGCSLTLDGNPLASCTDPLTVQFGVPFQIQVRLFENASGGAAATFYRIWELTTQNGTSGGGSFVALPFGVFQGGVPFIGATLSEVPVPEPATGLLLGSALAGCYWIRRRHSAQAR